MFVRGGKNHSSMVRHRPVNFICKKAVIFLYSIFTASDLKKKKKDFIYCLSLIYWTPIKFIIK